MNNNKNKQLLFGIIGIAILVIAVVGVTYAFFSYTRTGNTNTVQAGRIVFNSTQGDAINLSNAFPITSAQALTDTTNAKTLQITVSGDTSYSRGLEYLVTATDVHMTTTTGKTVPVTIEVSVTGNNSKTLGTSNNDYYTNRGGNTSMYNVEYDGSLDENDHILIGYIASDNNQTGVDGIINIKTYFNDADILITDTPDTVDTAGKTVLSTTEWNSLKGNNALSFKIKVEAREGTWVDEPPKNLANYIMSRVGQDGLVAVNTNGDLYTGTGEIREYRYSGGGRYCTYENNGTTYNLQIEGDTCPATAIYGGGPPGLYSSDSDNWNGTPSGTTYTLVSNEVHETNLKNYINFNNKLWRIIGVFDGKIKIIKDTPLEVGNVPEQYTTLAGDTITVSYQNDSGKKYARMLYYDGNNVAGQTWNDSSLKYYLNEENENSYYNNISLYYRNLISETYFNIGLFDYTNGGIAKDLYESEKNITWQGKIALLSNSDFGYASSSNNWSNNIKNYWSYGNVISDNWILHTNSNYNTFLNKMSTGRTSYWSDSGSIGDGAYNVSPVLYLKSNTLLYSGDGSYSNPYILIQQ